jgi:hypothetical protein
MMSFQSDFKFGKQKKSLMELSPDNRVDGTQRMSDILPDTADEERCMSRRIVCLSSDHVVTFMMDNALPIKKHNQNHLDL